MYGSPGQTGKIQRIDEGMVIDSSVKNNHVLTNRNHFHQIPE